MYIRDPASGKVTTKMHMPYIDWPTSAPDAEVYHAGGHGLLSTSLSLARVVLPLITSGHGVLQPETVHGMFEDGLKDTVLDGMEGDLGDLWPENGLGRERYDEKDNK